MEAGGGGGGVIRKRSFFLKGRGRKLHARNHFFLVRCATTSVIPLLFNALYLASLSLMRPPRAPGTCRLSAQRSSARVQSANQLSQQQYPLPMASAPGAHRGSTQAAPPLITTAYIRAPWAPASLLFNFEVSSLRA